MLRMVSTFKSVLYVNELVVAPYTHSFEYIFYVGTIRYLSMYISYLSKIIGKKKKEKEAERSLIVLDVKPWEADTDLKALWNKIIEYKQEGLKW